MAVGYLGDSQTLSERLQQRQLAPRQRKPLEEFVFSGSWNSSALLVTSQDKATQHQHYCGHCRFI